MLRITIAGNPAEQVLTLEGRLTSQNLPEVESAWERACSSRGTRRCVIDLRNATYIDPCAANFLLSMKKQGAHFIACGVSNTDQLKRLGIKCRKSSQKRQ